MKASIFFIFACLLASCQREYLDDISDKPTDKIRYVSLTASQDSAMMFEPVIITATAEGENLSYKWQRNKGTLIIDEGKPNTVQFWGCPTCLNWVTISCTVSNEYGSETKEVQVYVKKEFYQP